MKLSTQLSLFLFLILIISGCSSSSLKPSEKNLCLWKDINLNGSNNFCSTPRSALIDGKNIFLAFDNGEIVSWDINTNQIIKVLDATSDYTKRALVTSDNKLISGASDMQINIHSISGELIQKKNYSKGSIFNIIPYKNKLYIAFGNSQLGIAHKDSLDLLNIYSGHEYLIYSLMLDSEESRLYSGSDDETIRVWNLLNDGMLEFSHIVRGFESAVKQIIKTDNNILVTTGNGSIFIYDKLLATKISVTRNSRANIVSSLFHNNRLYVGDASGVLYIYDVKENTIDLQEKSKMNGLIRSICSFDGGVIVVAKSGQIRKIDD